MLIGQPGNQVELLEDSQEPKSPTTSFATQNVRCVRSFQLRSYGVTIGETEKWAAAQALLGYNTTEFAGAGPELYIKRVLPASYTTPETAVNPLANPILWASSIPSITPIAKPEGVDSNNNALYAAARLSVHYEGKLYNLYPDDDDRIIAEAGPLIGYPDEGDALRRGWENTRFIIRRIRDASTIISVPGGLFKYVDAVDTQKRRSAVIAQHPFVLYRCRVSYQWLSVPYSAIPRAAIANCANGVNESTFDRHETDTLRFDTFEEEHEIGPLGDRLVNLTYNFMWIPNVDPVSGNQIGHVGSFRVVPQNPDAEVGPANPGQFRIVPISVSGDPATANNDDQRPNKRVDFGSLFRPDPP